MKNTKQNNNTHKAFIGKPKNMVHTCIHDGIKINFLVDF